MSSRREYWRQVIFEHDTRAGKAFDVLLIIAILGSVSTVIADSLSGLSATTYAVLFALEWTFTLLFTVEYIARLWCTPDRRGYALSFFGIVDLLATLPTYISIVFPGGRFLALVRILRVLRVFRILKLTQYVTEANVLSKALKAPPPASRTSPSRCIGPSSRSRRSAMATSRPSRPRGGSSRVSS